MNTNDNDSTAFIRPTLLLETVHVLSRLAVIGVGLGVALLSAMAGSDMLAVAVRAGGAMLGMGLLLWFINWVLHRAVLEMVRLQLAEAAGQSSTEWEA